MNRKEGHDTMNKQPNAWNNSGNNHMPGEWQKNSNVPEGWQNKRDISDNWGNNKTPNNSLFGGAIKQTPSNSNIAVQNNRTVSDSSPKKEKSIDDIQNAVSGTIAGVSDKTKNLVNKFKSEIKTVPNLRKSENTADKMLSETNAENTINTYGDISEPSDFENNSTVFTNEQTTDTISETIVQQVEETSENINEFIDETTPADTISEAVVSENEYVTEPINYETTDTVIANEQTADTVTAPIVPQVEEIRKTVSESSYTQPVEPPKPVAPINRPVQNNYQRTVENNQFRNNNSFPYERNTEPKPVTQPNYQSNYENNQNTTNGLYTQYSQPKKSPVVPILCGVIGVLIVGGGILGGMLLMKNKNTENKDNSIQSDTDTTEMASIQTHTEKETETSVTSTTESEKNSISEEKYNTVLEEFLNSNGDNQYALYDLNNDGVKELFVKGEYGGGRIMTTMYMYDNGQFKNTDINGNNVKICINESLVECDIFGMGGANYRFYTIEKDDIKETDNLYSYSDKYYHGEEQIDESEFREILNEKSKLSWLEPNYIYYTSKSETSATEKTTSAPATASITIEPQVIFGNGASLLMKVDGDYSYFKYEIYADYEIYTNTLIDSGTIYDKSYLFEGGSTLTRLVFYVTPYNSDGVAGTKISKEYTGRLCIPGTSSSSPASVEKYGTIYSPTGAKIDGFTTSYVVNNGAVSYERHDLTNGWHIKAVRQYTSGGITWYELYDADDGDYYGWVDSNFISFY